MHQYRDFNCSKLTKDNIGHSIKLSGWVHSKRDHGDLIFFDLRDHYGLTQCVVDVSKIPKIDQISLDRIINNSETAEKSDSSFDLLSKISLESVITVIGEVVARDKEAINPKLPTGEIEVRIAEIIVESISEQIPFQVASENENYPEDLRLKYRFLDLRRNKIHQNVILRSKVISRLRQLMTEQDFLEIQTPILTASSPEGARDYLVPSRLHPGKFYALPQAPQQFKQLLMVSGFDRYFQIAPCFRDEDLRSDRSPEFYQLDMEMAFVTQDDVFKVVEPVLKTVFKEFGVKKVLDEEFIKIPYAESLLKYGSDKPDLRNPIIISDTTEVFRDSGFSIFAKAIERGAMIRAIPAPQTFEKPRSFFDKMIEFAISNGAKGLAYIIYDDQGVAKGPIAKLLNDDQLALIKQGANLENGDCVFFSCGPEKEAAKIAGQVRDQIASELNLIDHSVYKFCWIVDFPMYELDDAGKIDFSHNPFSMPQGGMSDLSNKNPLEIKAWQYDVVCNGIELSSGAIRNHQLDIMYKAFEIAGYSKDVVEKEFGALLNAFKFGAPPHGGIAPGIDRMIMLMADEPNIREIMPFPMNGKAQDLMMDSPSDANAKHLRELGIEINEKRKMKLEKLS